jgi:hypothetical protein
MVTLQVTLSRSKNTGWCTNCMVKLAGAFIRATKGPDGAFPCPRGHQHCPGSCPMCPVPFITPQSWICARSRPFHSMRRKRLKSVWAPLVSTTAHRVSVVGASGQLIHRIFRPIQAWVGGPKCMEAFCSV